MTDDESTLPPLVSGDPGERVAPVVPPPTDPEVPVVDDLLDGSSEPEAVADTPVPQGDPIETSDRPIEADVASSDGGDAVDASDGVAGRFEEMFSALRAIEQQLSESNQRAAHREKIIDRLHEENQELKAGGHRTVLEPVITDLMRLHQLLSDEVRRVAELDRGPDSSAGVLGVLVDEVEMILDRCGIERAEATIGERFQAGQHRIGTTVPTGDEGLHGTVALVISAGFVDRVSGRHRTPSSVGVYQLAPASAADPTDLPTAPTLTVPDPASTAASAVED